MLWRLIAMILIGSTLAVPLEGQRAGGGMHGGGRPVGGHGPGFVITGGFPSAPFRGNFGFRHFRNFGWYGGAWIPWDYPGWGYPWQSRGGYTGSAQNSVAAPIIIERSAPAVPALPPEPPKIVEAPASTETAPSQPALPALFVLANGERLEARRYMLTAEAVDIEVGGKHRRVPMSELSVEQTIAANRERGIEIRILHDTSEVFLGF